MQFGDPTEDAAKAKRELEQRVARYMAENSEITAPDGMGLSLAEVAQEYDPGELSPADWAQAREAAKE